MRLLDRLNRRVNGREYRKWYLSLPNADVEKLGWSHGQELRVRISGDRLMIEPIHASGKRHHAAA